MAIMDGFVYVGVEDPKGMPIRRESALPAVLMPGKSYIFHEIKEPEIEEIWVTLSKRLRTTGAKIIAEPGKDGTGLMYSYIGGPFFVIEFEFQNRRGFIGCHLTPRRAGDGDVGIDGGRNEYELRLEK